MFFYGGAHGGRGAGTLGARGAGQNAGGTQLVPMGRGAVVVGTWERRGDTGGGDDGQRLTGFRFPRLFFFPSVFSIHRRMCSTYVFFFFAYLRQIHIFYRWQRTIKPTSAVSLAV